MHRLWCIFLCSANTSCVCDIPYEHLLHNLRSISGPLLQTGHAPSVVEIIVLFRIAISPHNSIILSKEPSTKTALGAKFRKVNYNFGCVSSWPETSQFCTRNPNARRHQYTVQRYILIGLCISPWSDAFLVIITYTAGMLLLLEIVGHRNGMEFNEGGLHEWLEFNDIEWV